MPVIAYIMGLNHFIHHAALGNVELKKIQFVEFGSRQHVIFLKTQAVNRKIFTERASIHSAVGKYKIIVGHDPGTFKFFLRL